MLYMPGIVSGLLVSDGGRSPLTCRRSLRQEQDPGMFEGCHARHPPCTPRFLMLFVNTVCFESLPSANGSSDS